MVPSSMHFFIFATMMGQKNEMRQKPKAFITCSLASLEQSLAACTPNFIEDSGRELSLIKSSSSRMIVVRAVVSLSLCSARISWRIVSGSKTFEPPLP